MYKNNRSMPHFSPHPCTIRSNTPPQYSLPLPPSHTLQIISAPPPTSSSLTNPNSQKPNTQNHIYIHLHPSIHPSTHTYIQSTNHDTTSSPSQTQPHVPHRNIHLSKLHSKPPIRTQLYQDIIPKRAYARNHGEGGEYGGQEG